MSEKIKTNYWIRRWRKNRIGRSEQAKKGCWWSLWNQPNAKTGEIYHSGIFTSLVAASATIYSLSLSLSLSLSPPTSIPTPILPSFLPSSKLKSTALPNSGEDITCKIKFSGSNVLEGIKESVACGCVTLPVPVVLTSLPRCSTNRVTVEMATEPHLDNHVDRNSENANLDNSENGWWDNLLFFIFMLY